jgi:hypothetical protein
VKNKIIQNIAVAYVQGDETLVENGLMHHLNERQNVDELQELIWFIWTFRGSIIEDLNDKIIALWDMIDAKINAQNKPDRDILGKLSTWCVFIEKIEDGTKQLMINSVMFSDFGYDSYIIIEELRRLVDSQPYEVAEIYLKMMEGTHPTYEQENIEYILQILLQGDSKTRSLAAKIRDIYIENGIGFVAQL